MAIFDELQAKLASAGPKGPAVNYQQMAANVLKAKGGKAQPTGGPQASSLGQAAAAASVAPNPAEVQAAQAAQQQQAANMRAAAAQAQAAQTAQTSSQLADVAAVKQRGDLLRGANEQEARSRLSTTRETQEAQLASQFQKAVDQLATDRGIQESALFREFRQGNQELAARKDAQELENLAQQLALRDKDYVAKLNQVAAVNQLSDESKFREEVARLQADGNEDLARMMADWQVQYAQKGADFLKELNEMELDNLWKNYQRVAKAQSEKSMMTGGVGAGAAVAEHYAGSSPQQPAGTNSASGGGLGNSGSAAGPQRMI